VGRKCQTTSMEYPRMSHRLQWFRTSTGSGSRQTKSTACTEGGLSSSTQLTHPKRLSTPVQQRVLLPFFRRAKLFTCGRKLHFGHSFHQRLFWVSKEERNISCHSSIYFSLLQRATTTTTTTTTRRERRTRQRRSRQNSGLWWWKAP